MTLMVPCSTGKRRYGHPALNGVLPQPWLPLKKGQTLVNRERSRTGKGGQDAVVLTLRKRYSSVRKASRQSTPHGTPAAPSAGPSSGGEDERNPWQDGTPRAHPLSHHLEFDDASGVIMLPDDDWMMEDVGTESDSDYSPSPVPSREASSTAQAEPNETTPLNGAEGAAMMPSPREEGQAPASPRKRRYSTYYHHPERKRQSIPGAFPATGRS